MPRAIAILALVLAAAASPAAAQTVCRANALGSVICPAPPPEPLPILRAETQALDRVRRRAAENETGPSFVPAWRTNRLGTTPLTGDDTRIGGPCRADSFGNLRCR